MLLNTRPALTHHFTSRIQICTFFLLSCLITRSSYAFNYSESTCFTNCQCTAEKLSCAETTLEKINISNSVRYLQLVDVPMTELVTGSFQGSNDIKSLTLHQNGLRHLDFNFFQSFISIEDLNLARNEIRALDGDLLRPLIYLKSLVVRSNRIKKLDSVIFFNLTNLETIDFSHNQIVTPITRCMFKDNTLLKYLDLSVNQIEVIESDAFENNKFLMRINMSHNNILGTKTVFEDLTVLYELDLSHNRIKNLDKDVFEDCSELQKLYLDHNELEFLDLRVFQYLERLIELKLNNNPIKHLPTDIFYNSRSIQFLDISRTNLASIKGELLRHLKSLNKLNINNNTFLQHIDDNAFLNKPELKYVNLGFTNISRIPVSIISLDNLKNLSLEQLKIQCDCRFTWFLKFWQRINNKIQVRYSKFECLQAENRQVVEVLKTFKCKTPEVSYHLPITTYVLLTPAMLDCVVIGDPDPSITWFTPNGISLHDSKLNSTDHPRTHDNKMAALNISTMKVMENGSLYIRQVFREDVGNYTCFVLNKNGNISAETIVRLDPVTFDRRQFLSLAVGLSCAAMFLFATIIVQSIILICKKLCGKHQEGSPRTNIHQMIEVAEQYRAQQLEKLRENYTQQVKKIKDNCAQQTEWIWESYHGQVKNLKDMRDYGANHITSMKEQYHDQVKKVGDYTTSQLNRVRENYIFQRDKIRKFSAHQILRFRENCKYQQQAFNKVFENFNIENCKNGCGQSSSEINHSHDEQNSSEDILNDPRHLDAILPSEKLLSYGIEEEVKLEQKENCCDMGSSFSIYFTPTETTNTPITPRLHDRLAEKKMNLELKLPCLVDQTKLCNLLTNQNEDRDCIQIELKSRHNSVASVHLKKEPPNLESHLERSQTHLNHNNPTCETNQSPVETNQINLETNQTHLKTYQTLDSSTKSSSGQNQIEVKVPSVDLELKKNKFSDVNEVAA